jgi:uncharacterized protein involved in outer membrane biogenesis
MRAHSTLKLAVCLLAVLALLAAGLIVAVKSVNLDSVKELLTTQVKAATGRTLTIAGPLEMRLGLIPRVVADGVALSNPPGSSRPEMIKIKHFAMEVALLPLLKREILVNRLVVSQPDILIETEAKGPGNLDFGSPSQKSATRSSVAEESSAYRLHLHEVTIENGKVAWRDRGTGKTESAEIHILTIRPYQTSNDLFAVRLAAKVWERPVEIDGTVGRLDAAFEGKPWPIHLKAGGEGLALTMEGAIAELFAFRGLDIRLTAQGGELYEVAQLAGMAKPDSPQALGPFKISSRLIDAADGVLALADIDAEVGKRDTLLLNAKGTVQDLLGVRRTDLALTMASDNLTNLSRLAGTDLPIKGPVQLSGFLRGSGKEWKLSELKAGLGTTNLSGHLALQAAGRPHLSGALSADTLSLRDVLTQTTWSSEKTASQPVKGRGGEGLVIPDQPLPIAELRALALDADLSLQVGHLVLNEVQLVNPTVDLHLKEGRLVCQPFRTGLAGGNVEGEASLDVAGKVPVATLRLTAHQVELGKLDRRAISGGKSDLKMDLKGRGESVRTLIASASGETILSVGEGKIQNKAVNWAAGDLLFQMLEALNPLAKSEETTSLTCAAARFTINDGIATTNQGLGARTDKVDVVGSGTVDLRSETLDLGIRPRARGGVGLSLSTPLAGMIRLRGTFANPSVGMDSEGTLRAAASMGAAAATGGLSVLGELLVDKVSGDADPCRTALGQAPAKQKGRSQQKGQSQKQGGDSLFQGLFGR